MTRGSDTAQYIYDAADRLIGASMPDGVNISNVYDADGRRVRQTFGSQTTNYLWDETSLYGDVVLETSGSDIVSYVLGGTELISQTWNGITSYYLHDGQGSVSALTNASADITDTYSYTAFGEILNRTGTTVNAYQYTGQQYDSSTGLYNLRARYYDPRDGRFITIDPYYDELGNSISPQKISCNAKSKLPCLSPKSSCRISQCNNGCGSPIKPMPLHKYVYADANPVNEYDPSGLIAINYSSTIKWNAIRNRAALILLAGSTACVIMQVALTLAVVPGFSNKGKWTCVASCNIENFGNVPCAPLRVQAMGSGPSQSAACEDAKRNAVHLAPPGTYARHCQCPTCTKR